MNALTKQFFQAEFPGWQPSQDFDTVWQSFWTTREIPVLELNLGIDPSVLLNWTKQNNNRFVTAWNAVHFEQQAKISGREWYKHPSGQGRQDLQLSGTYPQRRKLLDNSAAIELDSQHRDIHTDAPQDLTIQLKQLGFVGIYGVKVAKLDPGGYLEPHKDPLMMLDTMIHLWIPLHQSQANLKIWPSGQLHHRVGCVYILNNQSFVHSIANFDTEPRYVVLAKIDRTKISADLVAKIRTALKQQWFSD
jgi:hypothetical protein